MQTFIEKNDGLTYFTYDNTANGKDFTYVSCVYKSADAFWLIQFSCTKSDYDDYKAKFVEWAQSVVV